MFGGILELHRSVEKWATMIIFKSQNHFYLVCVETQEHNKKKVLNSHLFFSYNPIRKD